MNEVFFTADTHFGHRMIATKIRGFSSSEEMDEVLIQKWNSIVKPGDRVYHLGDFSLTRDMIAAKELAARLNGQIFLIRGNHENVAEHKDIAPRFVWIKDYFFLKIDDQQIALSHYAHRVWNKSHHGSWHLYGHSHGSLKDDPNSRSFDVGVDCWGYRPLSFDEVNTVMSSKKFVPIDHHVGE